MRLDASPEYIAAISPHCRKLDVQLMTFARNLALASAGSSNDAKMAMMAMTTRSSIRVKPRALRILRFVSGMEGICI